jgi:putative hydrolase of the HAD superfamily
LTALKTAAILFDLGGTLDADGVAWKDRFHALLASDGHDVPKEAFDPAFYAADDALVGRIPRDLSFRETVRLLSEGLTRHLAIFGAGEKLAERFASESENVLRSRAALLGRLRAAHRLGVVSNFYGNLERVLSDVGLGGFFETAIDSEVVGFGKPDARIFRAALGTLGVAEGDALFVGDSRARDMEGARRIGMRHVWLRQENGASPCCEDDRVISRLEELSEVVS